MSDEIDNDLLKELGDLGEGSGEVTGSTALDEPGFLETESTGTGLAETGTRTKSGTTTKGPGGGRSRIFGVIALLAGIIGSLAMVLFAALFIRFGFAASDTVDRAMEPVEVGIDRMEARIDETDDLVDRDGIEPDRIEELQARADGLVDVATGAHQGFEAIEDHPVYSVLPAELSSLGDALDQFETSATTVDSLLGTASNGDTLPDAAVAGVADELDSMQSRVSDVRSMLSDAASSLRRWIRIGALLGVLGSLWGLWGQLQLMRRGWRGTRGRAL